MRECESNDEKVIWGSNYLSFGPFFSLRLWKKYIYIIPLTGECTPYEACLNKIPIMIICKVMDSIIFPLRCFCPVYDLLLPKLYLIVICQSFPSNEHFKYALKNRWGRTHGINANMKRLSDLLASWPKLLPSKRQMENDISIFFITSGLNPTLISIE